MKARLLSVVRQVLIAFGVIQTPRLQPIPLRHEPVPGQLRRDHSR